MGAPDRVTRQTNVEKVLEQRFKVYTVVLKPCRRTSDADVLRQGFRTNGSYVYIFPISEIMY